jgi:hypothetical protein
MDDSWKTWDRASRKTKVLAVGVWAIMMASLLYDGYLYTDYGTRMPSSPQQETGRVFAFEYKGRTVYVTKGEQQMYKTVNGIFHLSWVTCGVTFVIVGRLWKRHTT